MTREEELETALKIVWGALLLAKLRSDDVVIQTAFNKADALCRKTGLTARVGCVFSEG